jgi:TonB family protein
VVLVEVIVTAEGDVAEAHVVWSKWPEVDDAVVGAARQWKFRPATRSGKPIRVRFTVAVPLGASEAQHP